jgi:hypothetical protein
MRSTISRVIVLAFAVIATACAHPQAGSAPPDRTLITREQLQTRRFSNTFDAVQTLHAEWLTNRGTYSARNQVQLWVYFDNQKLGGVERLREIDPNHVAYIRFYDGPSAAARWGLDHQLGAIYVSTRN